MENKTKIVIASVAILVSFVFVAGYLYSNRNPRVPAQQENMTAANEAELQQHVSDIIKTKDISQCDTISDETYRKVCINNISINLAQETKDVSYCKKMDNDLVPIADCERPVIMEKSIETGNLSTCDEASNESVRAECKQSLPLSLALKKKDSSACSIARTEEEKNSCIDSFLFQTQFSQNATKFDCSQFQNGQTRSDCAIAKKESSKKQDGNVNITDDKLKSFVVAQCSKYSSPIFQQWCIEKIMPIR